MKKNKSPGPENISVKDIKTVDELAIEVLHNCSLISITVNIYLIVSKKKFSLHSSAKDETICREEITLPILLLS